jgi:hypothetical protein
MMAFRTDYHSVSLWVSWWLRAGPVKVTWPNVEELAMPFSFPARAWCARVWSDVYSFSGQSGAHHISAIGVCWDGVLRYSFFPGRGDVPTGVVVWCAVQCGKSIGSVRLTVIEKAGVDRQTRAKGLGWGSGNRVCGAGYGISGIPIG